MRNIIRNRDADFPEKFASLWLNGPEGGLETCNCLMSRVPPGHKGPRMHTHPVDQFYFVTEGTTTVQIGTEVFKVGPMSLVRFPAGTPHCNWNETDEYEKHFELMVPRPPTDRIIEYWEGEAPTIEGAKDLIFTFDWDGFPDRPFSGQQMAMRSNGSEFSRIYVARCRPGGHGPALHFHDFDQLYLVLEGKLGVQVGHEKDVAVAGDLVILPKGTVHTNWNDGDKNQFHLTMLIPEPAEDEQFDFKVDVQYSDEKAFQ